jgi:hypothetical protein
MYNVVLCSQRVAGLAQSGSRDMDLPVTVGPELYRQCIGRPYCHRDWILDHRVRGFHVLGLRLVEEWINVLFGGWLVISAWLLDVGASIAKVDFIASGVAVIFVCRVRDLGGSAPAEWLPIGLFRPR